MEGLSCYHGDLSSNFLWYQDWLDQHRQAFHFKAFVGFKWNLVNLQDENELKYWWVYYLYKEYITLSVGSILPHWYSKLSLNFVLTILYIMQVLCKLLFYNFYKTGLYDPLYSTVHPMKYLESDVIELHCDSLHVWLLDRS